MKSYRTYEMKNHVRETRQSLGLTQSDLALLCNTSRNTISDIENFKYCPSAYLAALLCDVLKCPFDDLFFWEYEGVKAPVYKDMNMPYLQQVEKNNRTLIFLKDFDAFQLSTMNPFFE